MEIETREYTPEDYGFVYDLKKESYLSCLPDMGLE